MLSVVNSAKFVLTLQSTPPFVIESIFALALAVLLAVPLIANLQFYLVEFSKGKKSRSLADVPSNESDWLQDHRWNKGRENSTERIRRRAVVMHYPAPISIATSSSSDFDLRGTPSRRTASTPNLVKRDDHQDASEGAKRTKPRKDVPLDRSSSYVATNAELPIIDISAFNYNSYRHKLIEASLKKRYRNRQPPGDVIFNSIHLNTKDSTLGIRLNDEYDHSFFDFVEEYYDATTGMSKKEMEFLHPLDHFLVRGTRNHETSEKATETDKRESSIDNTEFDRAGSFLDKNGNIPKVKGKNLTGLPSKPGNESPRSMDSKKDSEKKRGTQVSCPVDSNSIRGKPAIASNVYRVQVRKSPGRKPSNDTLKSRKLTSSIAKADKDSINVTLSSSSELGSAYSEADKQQPRKATSNHSHDSSVQPSSRSRETTRKLLPWITGNPSVSFNRKYGNRSPETLDRTRKRKVRSSERPITEFHSRPASPRPRSANLSRVSRKMNYQETIELETVESNNDYVTSKEELMGGSKAPEITPGLTFGPSTLPSTKLSSRPLFKMFVPFESPEIQESKRSTCDTATARSYAKFKEKRDRTGETKSMKTTVEENHDKNGPGINDQNRSKVTLNRERSNSTNRSCDTSKSVVGDDGAASKSMASGLENAINKAESWKETTLARRSNEKQRNDIFSKRETRTRSRAGLSNLDKTRELSRGNKSERCSRDKTDSSRSVIESGDTLVLATKDSRSEKENSVNRIVARDSNDANSQAKLSRNEGSTKEGFKLPRADSKVGFAMQTGLKNYIKTLKQVLKNGGNVDLVDLASLSLKDAISPELESILSTSELKELQDLLNIAEIKSNLAAKDNVAVV